MRKVAEHNISRKKAALIAAVLGIGLGFLNTALGVQFLEPVSGAAPDGGPGFFRASVPFLVLAGKMLGALVLTVIAHEAVHGLTALLFGRRPKFGLKLPLVYVTFEEKIPRGAFIVVAVAPLILLDIAFGLLVFYKVLPVFSYICVIINTVGAAGDMWIVMKLIPHARGSLVQDTKTGIEIWSDNAA
ncbi:MAG: DUF3267 domain-containing protein [Planctomycetota bacterium]|jgi:hypothetical protein